MYGRFNQIKKAPSGAFLCVPKSAGADLETALLQNKNIIPASGLPGIYTPQTAGEIIAQTVLRAVGRGEWYEER